ncbi:hypothetical protein FB45DRAFT_929816 [Roridomyces roridus]|uniref:BTB domain-containing protein n=1 Tax=Roridomyces roridus TaxID=1738132 RepID=A0AAD7FHC6_9AGAR|nr:hypothetical protein FB45DRAFT_929816 [Roridomyces roridus]
MNSEPKAAVQSTHYYMRDHSMLIFEAENVLFRVHEYFLHRDSPVLRDMMHFEISPNGPEPIFHLDGVSSKDFEQLLWLYYNPAVTVYDAPKNTWHAILRLADRWEMENIKKIALGNLLKATDLDPLEKIMLCEREDLSREQAKDAYAIVCTREAPLTVGELDMLSTEVISIITTARERIIALRGNAEQSTVDVVDAMLHQV